MIAFLKAYSLTILISLLLLVFAIMVIRREIKNKKNGVCSCGCDCSSCGGCCQMYAQASDLENK